MAVIEFHKYKIKCNFDFFLHRFKATIDLDTLVYTLVCAHMCDFFVNKEPCKHMLVVVCMTLSFCLSYFRPLASIGLHAKVNMLVMYRTEYVEAHNTKRVYRVRVQNTRQMISL